MLLSLLDRTSGEASVLGPDPTRRDIEIKRRVGCVAENRRMYNWMTVSRIAWFCSDLMKHMGLSPSDTIRSLSMGAKAKVALLLAMAHRPELLILDEPTSGPDVVRRDFLEGVIDLIQQEGRTIFFSSHFVHEVERVADWVGIIDRGQMIASQPIDDLKASVKRISMVFEESAPQVKALVRDFSPTTVEKAKAYKPRSVEVENLSLENIFVALVGKE